MSSPYLTIESWLESTFCILKTDLAIAPTFLAVVVTVKASSALAILSYKLVTRVPRVWTLSISNESPS